MTWRIFLIIAVSVIWVGYTVAQQDSIVAAIHEAEHLYTTGSYLMAEVEARRILEYPELNDSMHINIHKIIAFSLIAQGKPALAKEQFRVILEIDPSFSLDPVFISPKILIVFNETKESFHVSNKPKDQSTIVLDEKPQYRITYRAIVFPGWEQLYAGRKTTGVLFLGAGIASLGTGIACEFLRSSARREYLAVTKLSEINKKFDTYNNYYKAEIAAFTAFAIIYIVSEIEIFCFDHEIKLSPQTSQNPLPGFSLSISIPL